MREHLPVESDKKYGFEDQSVEETAPAAEILTKEASKVAAVSSVVQR
jgi:hypothetical protein